MRRLISPEDSPSSPPRSALGDPSRTFPSSRLEAPVPMSAADPAKDPASEPASEPANGRAGDLVRVAARAIGRAGLAHAYGHCSVRIDDATCLVTPAKPMGLVMATDQPVRVSIESPLPAG